MRHAVALVFAVLLLSPLACRATGSGNDEAASLAGASAEALPGTVLVCAVDGPSPRYEMEIAATGFDPQRGTTVAVFLRRLDAAGGKDLEIDGHGELDAAALDVVFEHGKLVAQAEGKTYVGALELSGEETPRNVRCQ